MYEGNHTVDDVKKFLKENNFDISKIENIDKNIENEKNIFFYNKKFTKKNNQISLNYNLRYFNRIISNRLTLKDRIIDKAKRLINI